MKKIQLLITAIFLIYTPLFVIAQNTEISGRVTDYSSGNPIPGVTITIEGISGIGTITNTNGEFTINAPSNAILIFSFIGYEKEYVKIAGKTNIQISLRESVSEIEELVIVGTSMKKSDLTGSVASVSAETIGEVQTSNLIEAIKGKVPGMYIQSNPRPGSKASLKIRGNNSIQFGTNPIFVVDGLVIDGGFEMLNPDDISSIDVLKDASATAIYGSRGANGVVVITTKKGKKGVQRVNYSTWLGIQEFSKEMPLMSGNETYDLRVDAYANAYIDKNPTADRARYIERSLTNPNPLKNLIFSKEELESYVNGDSYDWLDEVTRRGFQQNHAVSFSGGEDNSSYYASFNYNQQKGQIVKSGYKRYSGKVNLEQKIKPWLKFGTNNTLINTRENPVVNDNMFITALKANPLLPLNDEYWYMKEGKIDNQSATNPLRDLNIDRDMSSNRLLSSNYLNINPIKGLDIRSTFSIDQQKTESYVYFPTTSTQSYSATLNGQSIQNKSESLNWQWDNSISYDRLFAGKHRVSALIGSNMSYYTYSYNQQNASGYNNDLFSYRYSQGASDKEKFYLASNFSSYSMESFLARLNYSFDTRYYLTLTGRADGSSKFGPENKWGYFPSIAGSWNISNESFMSSQNVISNLKFRAGYGMAGNQNIPNYGYLTLYYPSISMESNILTNGGRYGNPNLRWEKQNQINLGIDAAFLSNRIGFSLDLFHINNEDLLMERSTAPSLGYLTKIDNVGALENKGIEFSLYATPINMAEFNWDLTFNIAADKNKITRLYEDVTEIYNLGGYSNNEIQREGNLFVGQSLNNIFVYKFDRIVQESDLDYVNSLELGSRVVRPGDVLPLDRDGNKIINDQDRFVVGTKDPDFYGGISSSMSYKGFSLTLNAFYTVGAKRISYLYETLMGSVGNASAHSDLLDRWTPEHTDTNIPRAYSDGGRFGLGEVDWAVQDASFFRLSEIMLSYNFSPKWMQVINVDNLRLYCTGRNLLTISPYKGYDPESGDWYPSSKTYLLGLNISF